MVCTGMADNIALTNAVRPAAFTSFPFQPGMRAATLSTSACSSVCGLRAECLGSGWGTPPLGKPTSSEFAEHPSWSNALG